MSKSVRRIEGATPVAWSAAYRLFLPEGPPPDGGHPILIALHGIEQDGPRLLERLPGIEAVRCALLVPNAPFPVEVRRDEPRVGYAWYQYTGDQALFERGLDFAIGHLERLLDHVAALYPVDRRRPIVMGYSQGGYVAGMMALRHPDRVGGLVALSTRIKVEGVDNLRGMAKVPIFVGHGDRDRLIPWDRQQESVDRLREAGGDVEVSRHDGGHGLPESLVEPIVQFVARVIASRR